MSRTTRKHLDWRYRVNGELINWRDPAVRGGQWIGVSGEHYIERNARDSKPWDKPAKFFKQMRRRQERARMKQAVRTKRDVPRVPRSDQWCWT